MPKVVKKETKVSKRGAKNEEVKQKKKKRAKKDPNAPKNPLSAYLLFCNDHRDSVKAKNPDASFGAIGRLLGDMWRGYTDAQKAPYNAKHEKAKAKYAQEKAAYDAKKSNGSDDDDDDDEEDESE
ncbi:Non-histone chromosomal protein 6 [Linnemannia schmuckeri]|uniref:Non-histone chromosomal protein 6 n=1 Tax=Linnemannia schmuckeri TaxID=64567 RepID=A0A9P5V9U5_9FUNG|nr:Non-histone chromosomal protein 6 [Linnemannia schmuckeri]